MITLLDNQDEATIGYRRWVDAMLSSSTRTGYGWVVDGRGVTFGNYGHGAPGTIEDQVMLGVDPDFRTGIAKIRQPIVSEGAKRKITLIGRNDGGRLILLREGRLTANKLSRLVVDDEFASFSGLREVPITAQGKRSDRHWYVVADLDGTSADIVDQTVRFANACATARARAGGGATRKAAPTYGYGMDEKGGVMIVTRTGGTAEVVRLQGFVSEQLKKKVGPTFMKPSKDTFCVDGLIEPANLLIEIKTGTSPHDLYEAVGQLHMYPTLIGLPDVLERMLLVPNEPPIKPSMAAALAKAGVSTYTYTISGGRKSPRITFPKALLKRCRRQATS